MPITKYVAAWLARAEDDIYTAALLFKEGGFYNQICFHTQQAVEKYLKGFLAFNEKHIRKVHDLNLVLNACNDIDKSFDGIRNDVLFFNKFYIETRYPGDFPEFSKQDAEKALSAAKKIKEFILVKIK